MLPTSDSKQQGPFEVEKQLVPMTYPIYTPGQPQASQVLYVNLKEWPERPERKKISLIRVAEEEEAVDDKCLQVEQLRQNTINGLKQVDSTTHPGKLKLWCF